MFPVHYDQILERLNTVDPTEYGRTRNFVDGDVSYLSPYISRGVLSTSQVRDHLINRGIDPTKMQKFLQELAWRDYWQQIWIAEGDNIDRDLIRPQPNGKRLGISSAIVTATTGIEAIDQAIHGLHDRGYIHNHIRMYIAAIACNIGQTKWHTPAKWMFYHLLDADWASNALSWQWVAGSNSGRPYIANQDNINKYCHTKQQGTFLDRTYCELEQLPIPDELQDVRSLELRTPLPAKSSINIDPKLPTLVYNFYNMDPEWKKGVPANRVLLLEPSIFERYPVSEKTIRFLIQLGINIPGLQVFVNEFKDLQQFTKESEIFYKEHPLNQYTGNEHPREWMFPVHKYYRSFSSFWKACQRTLQ